MSETKLHEWVTLKVFVYPQEAYILRSKLESEGIQVYLADELTVQVHNFYSNAIGGVKLQVKIADRERAFEILKEGGYHEEETESRSKFLNWFDHWSGKIPFFGKKILEIRLITIVLIFVALLVIIIAIASHESTEDLLTEHEWCVDQMVYKGTVLTPKTVSDDPNLLIRLINCEETFDFRSDGFVLFPGFNSPREKFRWSMEDGLLRISSRRIGESMTENNLVTEGQFLPHAIYSGKYEVRVGSRKLET